MRMSAINYLLGVVSHHENDHQIIIILIINSLLVLQTLDKLPCNFIGNKCITWYEIQGLIQEYFW